MKSMTSFYLLLACVFVLVILGGCASTKQIEVVATTSDRERSPMPALCYADEDEKFKGPKKVAGNQTPAEALAQSLVSNKRRMQTNEDRKRACECWQSRDSQAKADLTRLTGKCEEPKVATAEAKR